VEITLRKWTGEEDEQNLYQTLFNRRLRVSTDTPMQMDDETFRRFLHERIDRILQELKNYMEVQ
jgi:hypothetical protein